MKTGAVVLAAALLAAAASPASAFMRTEVRPPCAVSDPSRQVLFGDLHVHTRLSFDAFPWNPPLGPREAYEFATGVEEDIPPRDAAGNRLRARISKPLDFAAVTDHSEGLGETGACMIHRGPGLDPPECVIYRGEAAPLITPDNAYILFGAWYYGDPLPTASRPMPFCLRPDVDCAGGEAGLWQSIRNAAAEFYDSAPDCKFTTLVGYEWTATPLGANLHRNVIFRNSTVLPRPISKTDTGPDPRVLWQRLRDECITAGTGCDALVIPHNPNLSAGQQFPDPASAADAKLQAEIEPLIEIMQAKGSSECRIGLGTPDELCDFELLSTGTFFPFPRPAVLGPEFTERSFVRNILKEGLRLGGTQSLGVNPWRFGFVGDTDSHFGTPGNVDEATHYGTHPSTTTRNGVLGEIENNPGGLTAVWAEENSRDSIFEALRRRETYATSGTRPIVRFFGGWQYDAQTLCSLSPADLVAAGDAGGVPMGRLLAPRPDGAGAPRFAVSVWKDPDGADLQAVQIVKGWVDAQGTPQEKVFEAAGDRQNGATVDATTCAPQGAGSASLCAVWTDPEFDESAPAFWYVRVLENPSCRWSTRFCQANGVNPLGANCAAQAAAKGDPFPACCNTDPVRPVIQERAWTSPIWWRTPDTPAPQG